MADNEKISDSILELIAISGELSEKMIGRLNCGKKYLIKTISELKKFKFIKQNERDNIKFFRLTSVGKKLLLTKNYERFAFYLTDNADTNHLRTDPGRRLRLNRTAEIILIMKLAGIKVFCDEKTLSPYLISGKRADNSGNTDIIQPEFYTSREIKTVFPEFSKARTSRASGILVTNQDLYVIFNTGETMMRWEPKSEEKFKMVVSMTFARKLYGKVKSPKAIIFGNSEAAALKLLMSDGGYKKQFLALDGTYECMFFLPNDNNGELLLKLFSNKNLYDELYEMLKSDLYDSDAAGQPVDCDGNPVLIAFDFNLQKIKAFNSATYIKNKSGTIICFDFQEESVKKYVHNKIKIKTISKEKFTENYCL